MERQSYGKDSYCYIDQYRLLKQCAEQKNTTKWNEWREKNPNEKIMLCGAEMCNWDLTRANLSNVNFWGSNLSGATLFNTQCNNSIFIDAKCINTLFFHTNCDGAYFNLADLSKARFVNSSCVTSSFESSNCKKASFTKTDISNSCFNSAKLEDARFISSECYSTEFLFCYFSNLTEIMNCSFDNRTTISNYLIGILRIDAGARAYLEHNCRHHNWNAWYKNYSKFSLIVFFVKFFWYISDYGYSTKRVLIFFLLFILLFTSIYYEFPEMLSLNGVTLDTATFFSMLTFACSTMVTLGFSNINVSVVEGAPNTWGMFVVSMNLIVGYFMLAVLVTRLGILFQSLGPGYVAKKKKAVKPK